MENLLTVAELSNGLIRAALIQLLLAAAGLGLAAHGCVHAVARARCVRPRSRLRVPRDLPARQVRTDPGDQR